MPNCHIIEMPIGTYSDKFHKWGVTDLHFCREFYDYLYECFDMIASGKEKQLSELLYEYSKMLTNKRERLIWNSVDKIEKENLLFNDLSNLNTGYIVEKGVPFYIKEGNEFIKKGKTNRCFLIEGGIEGAFSKFTFRDKIFFARSSECKMGFSGHGYEMGKSLWKLQNQSTLVEISDKGVLIGHNGSASKAQTQIISTIQHNEKLRGKVVTFSVWARVLQKNDDKKGGCIAFINANDYNAGTFCAKEEFDNIDWKKITLSYWIPEKDFKGLTVCLRALASDRVGGKNAKVEFYLPTVQIGSFTS